MFSNGRKFIPFFKIRLVFLLPLQAVGGDNSWGAKPLKKYLMVKNQTYSYKFLLFPPFKNP
ncbi:MAG: hypothetical protein DRO88_01490 [Promethearchaeia archaeon]|nr:MAG: hypothetical protein DRO88_01490 [Candidatus Lokiarchaeia archaeon]